MTEDALTKPAVLPPKGLFLTLVSQLPLLAASLPLRPAAWEVLTGAAFLAAGVVLNLWSERWFRRHDVGVCPFTPVSVLIVRGPYRLTRNPMYAGLVSLALGVAMVTGVPANAWSAIAYAIWLHHAYVLPEERFLRARLGSAYEEYASRVPRWLPAPW